MAKSYENLKKTTRLYFQSLMLLLVKSRYYVIIAFKMIEIEFKVEYTKLAKQV